MKKKSFYNNYYDGYYFAEGDIVNAKGDIVNAKGDIVNAKGDIVNAKGDIINAKGDIVKSAGGEGCFWWDLGYDSYAEYKADYGSAAQPDTCEESDKKKGGKLFGTVDTLLGFFDRGTDTYLKLKHGTTVEDGGVDYSIKPTSERKEKDMTMWYVAGGAIVLVVIGAIVLKGKK